MHPNTDAPKVPLTRAVAEALTRYREQAEGTPDAIQACLEVAIGLLFDSFDADPPPFATHRHICALIDCARIAAGSLAEQSGRFFCAVDTAGGAA